MSPAIRPAEGSRLHLPIMPQHRPPRIGVNSRPTAPPHRGWSQQRASEPVIQRLHQASRLACSLHAHSALPAAEIERVRQSVSIKSARRRDQVEAFVRVTRRWERPSDLLFLEIAN